MRGLALLSVLLLAGCVEDAYRDCWVQGHCVDPAYVLRPLAPMQGVGSGPGSPSVAIRWRAPDLLTHVDVEVDPCADLVYCFSQPAKKAYDAPNIPKGSVTLDVPPVTADTTPLRVGWRIRGCYEPKGEPRHCGPWSRPRLARLGHPDGPVLGDLDGDGRSDVVIADSDTSGGKVYFWRDLAISGPVLSSPVGGPSGPIMTVGLAGDVDGDGFQDVVAMNDTGTAAQLYIASGRAAGLPDSLVWFDYGPQGLGQVLMGAGDLDRDGRSDIVYENPYNREVRIAHAPGSSIPGYYTSIPNGGSSTFGGSAAGIRGFSGSHRDNVLITDGTRVVIARDDGGGAIFTYGINVPVVEATRVAAAGDLDADGYEDFLVAGPAITAVFGAESGSPTHQATLQGTTFGKFTGCDVDGDGATEIVAVEGALANAAVKTWKLSPDGESFVPFGTDVGVIGDPSIFASALACVGDVDGNGTEDFALNAQEGGVGKVLVVHTEPDGVWGAPEAITPDPTSPTFGISIAGIR